MSEEFHARLSKLSKRDQDILACATYLGINPFMISNVEWINVGNYPNPIVSIRIQTILRNHWSEGEFPWTKENLPSELNLQAEAFLRSKGV